MIGEYQRVPDSDPSGLNPIFCVPEYQQTGVAYVVRVRGWKRRDPDNYMVCVGGSPRPHSGPFATAAEAEAVRDRANKARA